MYKTLYRHGNLSTTIFENPTSTDFQEIVKTAKDEKRILDDLRFIADAKNQKVYVADSWYVTHLILNKVLSLPSDSRFRENPWLLQGVAIYKNGGAHMVAWDKFDFYARESGGLSNPALNKWAKETLYTYKWGWADRYIKGISSTLDFYKKEYERYEKRHF